MTWCVMMTYTKTALVILGGAFVGLSGHDCHGFCGKNHPMQTLPSSNTTPTKKQKNIQQRPTKNTTIQKSLNFCSNKFFTSLFKLVRFPKVLWEYNKERHECSCQLIHRNNLNSKGFATIVQDLSGEDQPKPPHHQGGCRLIQL